MSLANGTKPHMRRFITFSKLEGQLVNNSSSTKLLFVLVSVAIISFCDWGMLANQ